MRPRISSANSRGITPVPLRLAYDRMGKFRLFASGVHHAPSGIHTIFILMNWQAAIVHQIRAAFVEPYFAITQRESSRPQTRSHLARFKSAAVFIEKRDSG